MTDGAQQSEPPASTGRALLEAPLLRGPEGARTVFRVTLLAACAPLLVGLLVFGWRAGIVTALAVGGCALLERFYYRVTRVPALHGRSHAVLTGLLLALTLPAFVPWFVPLVAAAFAILVGKAVFGGVGHFLWQPALVGRLAVAVLFPATMNPAAWPVLAQDRLLVGDLNNAAVVDSARLWRGTPAPERADALAFRRPEHILSDLTDSTRPAFSALNYVPADLPRAKPAALRKMPPIEDLLLGTHPGGLGETSAFAIAIALLYLVYRSYIKWQLPLAMVLAAATVAAIAPVYLAGPNLTVRQVWWPVTAEGFDVGIVYVTYQVLTGELLLAALLATEMTSRPVTTNGRIVFGLGCGAVGMLMRLFLETPIPFYMAVLAMNTLTPTIEAICRPRVFGRSRLEWLKRRQAECGQNTTTN